MLYSRVDCLWQAQLGLCYLCGEPMNVKRWSPQGPEDGWTEDHVHPRAMGGQRRKNILLAHVGCNTRKDKRRPTSSETAYARQMHRVANVLMHVSSWPEFDQQAFEEAFTCRQVHSLSQLGLARRSAASVNLHFLLASAQSVRSGSVRQSRKSSSSSSTPTRSKKRSTQSST